MIMSPSSRVLITSIGINGSIIGTSVLGSGVGDEFDKVDPHVRHDLSMS